MCYIFLDFEIQLELDSDYRYMKHFQLDQFIKDSVIERQESFFKADIENNQEQLRKAIQGKSVIVIGGAGTIGSSYIKAILPFQPARLYVIDINENALTELVRDLRSISNLYIPTDFKTYPINFSSSIFAKILTEKGSFDIVANFAAHKHVRSEKDHYSIEAMVDNNVIQTKKLLDLLVKYPPKHFFCVSTDKAANPVNVMGASKKLMEEVILAYSKKIPITTARFANVAFSNGSLLFGFIQRMMKQQPLAGPNDVKRYFVSPIESGQICMLACFLGKSGEIFFPKLQKAQMKTFSEIGIRFLKAYGNYEPDYYLEEELARNKAKNLTPNSPTYPVCFKPTGTSGEKPYEEFYVQGEDVDLTTFNQLGVIKNAPSKPMEEIDKLFNSLNAFFTSKEVAKEGIVEVMMNFIPNFKHIETGTNLDQKM